MKATAIKRISQNTLQISWDDNHVSLFSLHHLRDECPCAECKGEEVLFQLVEPSDGPHLPGRYELRTMTTVGSYAVQIGWGDGHEAGLYSWEYLRAMCPCDRCRTTTV